MSHISYKLRDSARGQTCTFQIPRVCNHNPETTVLCHAPSEYKGMGNKSPDYMAAFGCSDCHPALDNHEVNNELFYWLRAVFRTWAIWIEKGIIVVPISKKRKGRKLTSRKAIPSRGWQKRKEI